MTVPEASDPLRSDEVPLIRNRLLNRLDAASASLMRDNLEPVSCPTGMCLVEANAPIEYVYFLNRGVASVVAERESDISVEVGIIGREGVVLPNVALGVDRVPYTCMMQLEGDGQRIAIDRFQRIMEDDDHVRSTMLLMAQCYIAQSMSNSVSNATQPVDVRLARWILMCHDRSDSDDLPLTHKYMAVMLAVRRPSVTTSLHMLEGMRFIRNERNSVLVSNRAALESFARGAYGVAEAEYRRLIGPL